MLRAVEQYEMTRDTDERIVVSDGERSHEIARSRPYAGEDLE